MQSLNCSNVFLVIFLVFRFSATLVMFDIFWITIILTDKKNSPLFDKAGDLRSAIWLMRDYGTGIYQSIWQNFKLFYQTPTRDSFWGVCIHVNIWYISGCNYFWFTNTTIPLKLPVFDFINILKFGTCYFSRRHWKIG